MDPKDEKIAQLKRAWTELSRKNNDLIRDFEALQDQYNELVAILRGATDDFPLRTND